MIYVLCGKSASGKDTLLKELINEGFEPLISTTSRPMRDGEQDGREYNFVSREEFEKRLADGKFIEHRSYDTLVEGKPDTWYYGMEKCELDKGKDYIVILDLEGAKAFKEAYKDEVLCVYVDVDDARREEWAKGRGSFDKSEWDRRLADDKVKFSQENVQSVCDYSIFNGSTVEVLKYQFAQVCVKDIHKQNRNLDNYNVYERFGDGADSHRHAIDDFLLEYGQDELYRFQIKTDDEKIFCHNNMDMILTLRDLQERGEKNVLLTDLMTDDDNGNCIENELIKLWDIDKKTAMEVISQVADLWTDNRDSKNYKEFERKCLNYWCSKDEYIERLKHHGYTVDGQFAILEDVPSAEHGLWVQTIERAVIGSDRPQFYLITVPTHEYESEKIFDTFKKIDNALISNGILYAYNKNDLKERGFTDNQIADLQSKNVDEDTAIKFIGYACDLLDETTNTKTVDVLAKQGIYNVPTELAQKISAEKKFAPYEYSKSDEVKDIIGNALEDMEQLLSVVEQLQEEGVKVPIGDMDLAQMKADCKNLANLHWDMKKDDVDKAMAEFTKSDVNIPKNDVKNKDNIRKD